MRAGLNVDVRRTRRQPVPVGRRRSPRGGRVAQADFRRDRLTWVAYVMLGWFAYLQAAPGLVIVHLRDELDLSYSTGGLHVAAFAAGSLLAGVDLRAARARARAAHAVLVGGRADGRGSDRVDGGAHRCGDRRLGAGHGPGRRAAARDGPGGARRSPRRASRGRADRGERGRQRRLRRADRRAVADGRAGRGLAGRAAGLARGPGARVVGQPAAGDRRATAVAGGARSPARACSGSPPRCCSARPRPSGASPPGARPSSKTPPACRPTPPSR